MSNVEYDLDTSSEVMKEIQKLISPPESEESSKTKKREGMDLHPYFRRPGKGHNHDSCDSCGEGGDLLCCDRCPASFHLECHDPPLEQKDIPSGEWICHKCRCKQKIDEDEKKTTRSRKKEEKKDNKDDSKLSSRAKRAKSRAIRKNVTKGAALKTVLDYITKVATEMNPKQFELPPEMRIAIIFPGTDKAVAGPSRVNTRRTSAARKKGESEGGTSSKGPKQCFFCSVGSQKAPLIQCDFCVLLYHQDCLDPPLASLPVTRWMCPAHVEHFVDRNMLKTCGITERLKLWEIFSQPIDQDAIKIDFLRKVNRKNPPFNFKVRLPSRNTVRVPDGVKEAYKNPVDCVPSLHSDLLKIRSDAWRNFQFSFLASEDEQMLFLSAVSALLMLAAKKKTPENVENDQVNQSNCDISEVHEEAILNGHAVENECEEPIESRIPDTGIQNESAEVNSDKNGKNCDDAMEVEPECTQLCNGNISDPEVEIVEEKSATKNDCVYKTAAVRAASESSQLKSGQSELPPIPDNVVLYDGTRSNVLAHSDLLRFLELYSSLPDEWDGGDAFKNMDNKMIKLLAFERMCQIRKKAQIARTNIDITYDIDISKLDGTELLDEECDKQDKLNLPEPLSSNNSKVCQHREVTEANNVENENVPVLKSMSPKSNFTPQILGIGKINAVISPLRALNRGIKFVSRTCITFGSGKHADIDVMKYGFCNYISEKHATIFYDAITHRYELINYSEHGTYVDMIWCSSAEKRKDQKSLPQSQFTKVVKEIEVLQQKRINLMSQTISELVLTESNTNPPPVEVSSCSPVLPLATIDSNQKKCLCDLKSHTVTSGWEGSARLNHGSLIHCGCIEFVFSILPPDPTATNTCNQLASPDKENMEIENGEASDGCQS